MGISIDQPVVNSTVVTLTSLVATDFAQSVPVRVLLIRDRDGKSWNGSSWGGQSASVLDGFRATSKSWVYQGQLPSGTSEETGLTPGYFYVLAEPTSPAGLAHKDYHVFSVGSTTSPIQTKASSWGNNGAGALGTNDYASTNAPVGVFT